MKISKKTIVNLYESGKRKTDLTREYGISYTIETGWTYLAIVMDLFDLKIVGWSYDLI